MIDQAIKKIEDEMTASKDNSYIQYVGTMLLAYLQSNPTSAESVLAENKSIANSLNEMRKVAEKNKVGNVAVLSDQEGFAVVLEYFGITDKSSTKNIVPTNPATSSDFNVSLDDLLGG